MATVTMITLIGVGHVFAISRQVKEIIRVKRPDVVCIELDSARFASLQERTRTGRVPIQYSLTYPGKINLNVQRLDFKDVGTLTFEAPDMNKFPCIALAFEAGKAGGTLPAVMNAANEVAVEYFLKEKITFLDIPELIEKAMANHTPAKNYTLEEILEIDQSTRQEVAAWVS